MSQNTSVYHEEQKFTQRWLWLILYAIIVITLAVPVIAALQGSFRFSFLLPAATSIALLFSFRVMRLTLQVDDKEISYRFTPFFTKYRSLRKDEISRVAVVKYRPVWEFGGWGIRYGRSGKAYTTAGDYGMRVTLKSGKQILIGTMQPQKLSGFLERNGYTA